MRIVIQRVKSAQCIVENKIHSEIKNGLLLLSCVEVGDTETTIQKAVQKISQLRIFTDDNDKMNLNIQQVNGEILNISQFTLSWDGQKGNRPNFSKSMPPEKAHPLYIKFNSELNQFVPSHLGAFGEHMDIQSINDGPVSFLLEF